MCIMQSYFTLSSCFYTQRSSTSFFFFFNDTATTEIYTLSLHDALPICFPASIYFPLAFRVAAGIPGQPARREDRKSTRLNSSHSQISYAVFCLKKKKISYKRNLRQS